jgi:pilus assembly protein Flp/PilA
MRADGQQGPERDPYSIPPIAGLGNKGQQCFTARAELFDKGDNTMNMALLKLHLKFQDLMNHEEGQDLVEYALLVSLVALGCIASVGYVATAIKTVFSNISTSLA